MLLVSFIKDRIWIGEYFQWHCRLILLLHLGLGSLVGANLSWGLTGLQTVMASNFSRGISENLKGVLTSPLLGPQRVRNKLYWWAFLGYYWPGKA